MDKPDVKALLDQVEHERKQARIIIDVDTGGRFWVKLELKEITAKQYKAMYDAE
jgi:hypothetical protein